MTNDLSEDGHEIVKILDFKTLLNDFLKTNLEFLSEVRIIEFTNSNTKVSLDLRRKPDIELNLIKNNSNILDITQKYPNLKPVYNDFIPIKKEKFENIKKLLNYVVFPEVTTFYSNQYLKIKEKHNLNLNKASENFKCSVKKCICKSKSKFCTHLCSHDSKECENINKNL
jgi:hypothetical protein